MSSSCPAALSQLQLPSVSYTLWFPALTPFCGVQPDLNAWRLYLSRVHSLLFFSSSACSFLSCHRLSQPTLSPSSLLDKTLFMYLLVSSTAFLSPSWTPLERAGCVPWPLPGPHAHTLAAWLHSEKCPIDAITCHLLSRLGSSITRSPVPETGPCIQQASSGYRWLNKLRRKLSGKQFWPLLYFFLIQLYLSCLITSIWGDYVSGWMISAEEIQYRSMSPVFRRQMADRISAWSPSAKAYGKFSWHKCHLISLVSLQQVWPCGKRTRQSAPDFRPGSSI